MRESNWIDVSVPLRTGMVHWPGDPEPTFERISELEHGADANVTLCRMTAHTGTHMDAPVHFLPGQVQGIDRFPIEAGIGPARVVQVDAPVVTSAQVEPLNLQPGERVLFRTRNSSKQWAKLDFLSDFVGLDASAALVLAERKVTLVGVDYLSVGVYRGDGAETHRRLLAAGIWILEGLELANIQPGNYDMICLPLRIEGADGSPARVVLRQIS